MKHISRMWLSVAITLLVVLTACGELTFDNPNGTGSDPQFSAYFRHGSAFPHADPADDVLILELGDTDIGEPPTARVYIDGDKVRTLRGDFGQTIVPFPPDTWELPTAGEHTALVGSGGIERTLDFTWN